MRHFCIIMPSFCSFQPYLTFALLWVWLYVNVSLKALGGLQLMLLYHQVQIFFIFEFQFGLRDYLNNKKISFGSLYTFIKCFNPPPPSYSRALVIVRRFFFRIIVQRESFGAELPSNRNGPKINTRHFLTRKEVSREFC